MGEAALPVRVGKHQLVSFNTPPACFSNRYANVTMEAWN